MSTVRRDFFLNPQERLTEQERALMTAMLHGLVADIADELRAALAPGLAVANDDDNPELVAELSASGLLDIPDLIALLLRRADEEQIANAVRTRAGRRDGRLLQALVSDENASVSAAAMALILARGRRRDRFGQLRIEFDDLPADVADRLVHIIAAALRRRLTPVLDPASADRQLATAALAVLSRQDSDKGLDTLANDLIRLLDDTGRLDDGFVGSAADEGEIALMADALARRAAIPPSEAAALVLGGPGGRLMLLLRMAGASRELAARLLGGLGELVGISDAGHEIGRFDSLRPDEVESARERLKLDPAYRTALAILGESDGQRPV